ncbi:cytochrome P450 [Rhizopogon vinicolor AM-OR11-026]|uniref:Cytochrome P450 n=1 Tax=Rhizopogon vinicolor AM-OR11-026 TaxID=1314800 RepID=A0A1B7MGB4_9AGAM|nr:cytochrome P450 [Rhizopogon vinicolor AM-OR11-026]
MHSLMASFQSFIKLLPSFMFQLPDLHRDISDGMQMQLVLDAAACLAVVGVITQAYLTRSESGLPLPPSPPTWRLWGHLLPPREVDSLLTIGRWIDEHGPLITIRSGTKKIVIIGRHKAAVDIMQKQGQALADRPRMIAAAEMFAGGLGMVTARAGDRWRRMRRILHTHLQPKSAEAYQPLQMSYAKAMVLGILDNPHDFQSHVMTYAATTIMKVAYGKDTPTFATDPDVRVALQALEEFRKVLKPGAYLVDSIPWLKYFPWYGKELKRGFEIISRLHTSQLNSVKQRIVSIALANLHMIFESYPQQSNTDVGPSFAKYVLENGHSYGITELEAAFLGGAFFAAGSSTTSVAMCTVMMAAACFPEEQAKVQAELDAVVGMRRAPTFADRKSLPRLQAFISEALRWRPVSASGFAHRTTKDVIWENYCIPAGTTVFGNHWAISRDPEVYPEPDAFKPERWINDEGRLRDDLKFFVYGFGRRVCPGQHIANRSVFITSLLILWAFRLALDPTASLDDMGFMGDDVERPCTIEFKMRVPEAELRHVMLN